MKASPNIEKAAQLLPRCTAEDPANAAGLRSGALWRLWLVTSGVVGASLFFVTFGASGFETLLLSFLVPVATFLVSGLAFSWVYSQILGQLGNQAQDRSGTR